MSDRYDLRDLTISLETFKQLGTQPRLFLPVFLMRHCSGIFCIDLEYTHFSPFDHECNREFEMLDVGWHGERWIVVSIPARCRPQAIETARRYGLRLANGEPYIIKSGGVWAHVSGRSDNTLLKDAERFVLHGPDVWTIEYDTKIPNYHRTMRLSPREQKIEENALIDGFFARLGIERPSCDKHPIRGINVTIPGVGGI